MSGSNVTMDSEGFCFEVPIVNLDGIGQTKPTNVTENQDCTIIVPKDTQKNNNNNNIEPSSHSGINKDIPIVIDEDDRSNDCSIIDDHTDSKDDQTIHNSSNISGLQKTNKVSNMQSKDIEKNFDIFPINLDDDTDCENDCSIVDITTLSKNDQSTKNKKFKHGEVNQFDEIYRKNKVLAKLIKKCLNMENSMGMLRIINRTLIPIYNDTTDLFKESGYFKSFLIRTLDKLETVPQKKFMHLKALCEVMKSGHSNQIRRLTDVHMKKRIQLTTLKRNLNGQFSTNEIRSSNDTTPKKKTKLNFIDLDDDDDDVILCSNDTGIQINDVRCQAFKEMSVQNDYLYRNQVEITNNNNEAVNNNEHSKVDDDVVLVEDDNSSFNKENVDNQIENTSASNISPIAHVNKDSNTHTNGVEFYNDAEINHTNKLSDSSGIQNSSMNEFENDEIKRKIEHLEVQIRSYSILIKVLDEKEVNWDITNDALSPYVQSEFYKNKIVAIYKELCRLTGTEAVKRRKVRLKAAEGRHKGPSRCLEAFINRNIGADGNPPFPDMLDVTRCVSEANDLYRLGWSKKQIESEARALFVHYGRTVQKARQKREWRHLMRYVKDEMLDPAEVDPSLQAQLEANAKVAGKNEMDILERYVQMENSTSIARVDIEAPGNKHYSDSGESFTAYNETILNRTTVSNTENSLEISSVNKNIVSNDINHVESNSNQVTNNVVTIHPFDSTVAQFTPTISYPIKYIVIDENMRPIGVAGKPLSKCGETSNVDFFANYVANNLKDTRHELNSINRVDSTNQDYVVSNQILQVSHADEPSNIEGILNAPLENNDVTTTNTVDKIRTQIIKDTFKNAEAYIELDIKPNI